MPYSSSAALRFDVGSVSRVSSASDSRLKSIALQIVHAHSPPVPEVAQRVGQHIDRAAGMDVLHVALACNRGRRDTACTGRGSFFARAA